MIEFRCALRSRGGFVAAKTPTNRRTVLVGDVVPMVQGEEVMRDARVCVEGNTIIAVVDALSELPAKFRNTPQVQTAGTIYPGLIDLHNHLIYNHIPLWSVPARYTNRESWRTQEPQYHQAVLEPFHLLADNADLDYRRAIVRFSECRNLLGGVTTGQGMSMSGKTYFKGLMRNVEQPMDSSFPTCHGQTLNFKPGEVESVLVPALAKGRPYFYHLSEGTDPDARQMFLNLQLADGSWAIKNNLVCIHCVALQPQDFDVLRDAAGMVWSPTSNFLLYGATADVASAKRRGIPIAIGADWAPSGCKNLLGELKVARAVSTKLGGIFSPRELVEAVTIVAAHMIGWDSFVGTVAEGRRADLLVLEGRRDDPYTQLIEANEASIRAVLIDGQVRMAEAPGLAIGDSASSEVFTIGGKQYVIDLTERTDDGMGGMLLSTAINKLAYGLAHLPDLANSFVANIKAYGLSSSILYPRLLADLEEEAELKLESFLPMAGAPVHPMSLASITAVDDLDLGAKMRASINLPDFIKAVF
jgi:5-methylthioadenosine/S-adenosylhomocysteine deaminase